MQYLPIKLKNLIVLCLSTNLWLTACASLQAIGGDMDVKNKFRGMAVEKVIDGVNEYQYVTITREGDIQIDALAKVGPKNRHTSFSSSEYPVPKTIHVKWRNPQDGKAIMDNGELRYEGTVIGDYTVPVAERIPDAILNELHKGKSNLRLKIRLIDDGILVGWDIERRGKLKGSVEYVMAGGDFVQAERFNGKVVRKGWYINKNGQKIETDY